jgi:hypothetical protein
MTTANDHTGGTDRYEIIVEGHLDERWSAWFDGLVLTRRPDATTAIHAAGIDQAALHGLLARVRDIGVRLVAVRRIDDAGTVEGAR